MYTIIWQLHEVYCHNAVGYNLNIILVYPNERVKRCSMPHVWEDHNNLWQMHQAPNFI